MSTAKFDGVVFEMEHNPWDGRALRDCLQYMLNRAQIVKAGSLAPAVTPMVRVPVNGVEKGQWHAKQALDIGCYGIVWPHISTVEEAYNAVAACRYPRLKTAKNYEPAGIRGDGPTGAVRYWGLTQQEYYAKADVWPLDPNGEIFVILQIEDMRGVDNLDKMLTEVKGIGAILIGEGDLGQELGIPRQYEHPELLKQMARVVETCKKHNVVVGHPHVEAGNCRAHPQGRLSLPDVRADAQLRPSRQGARRGGTEIADGGVSEIRPGDAADEPRRLRDDQGAEKRRGEIRSGDVRFLRTEGRQPGLQGDGARAQVRRRRTGDRHVPGSEDLRQAGDAAARRRDGTLPASDARCARPRAAPLGAGRRSRASGSASAPTRRRPASGCAASSSTNTAST